MGGVNASASWKFGEFQLGLKEMMLITSLTMFPLQDICVYSNTSTRIHTHTQIEEWDWLPGFLGIVLLRDLPLTSLSNLEVLPPLIHLWFINSTDIVLGASMWQALATHLIDAK